MEAQVIFEVTSGSLQGQKFVFDNIITTLLGRHPDCYPKLPEDDTTVSRYHCVLDINPLTQPPQVRIRDDGSCAGTYLNGEKIGQRSATQTPEESCQNNYPFHPLKTGDEICIGKTTLRVSIEILSDEFNASPFIISSPSQAFFNSPPQIPGYAISKELGRGGFGVVYLADDEKTEKPIALKVIRPQKQADENARKKFLREIKVSQYFNHPHIVQVLDAGEVEDLLFLALEFCPYGTVNDLLKQYQYRLPIDLALHIIHQILDGLDYAHNLELSPKQLPDGTIKPIKGIVHRDLKPGNILCVSEGEKPTVKIADFGLAKAFDLAGLNSDTCTPDNSNSENPSVSGTYVFMCRQQVLDFKYAKPEVDVWAVVACLYNMLTGLYPRNFSKGENFLKVVLNSQPIPIRKRNTLVPKPLAEVIDLALIDQHNLYFRTAAELQQALQPTFRR